MTRAADPTPDERPAARIALVDDDTLFLRVFADNLQAAGYQTICFDDPRQALVSLCRDAPPDVCVLDWDMPGLDGLALHHELRAHGVLVPVLFLTSHGQPLFEEAALDAGAVDFVDKSRGPAIILQRLSIALTRRAETDPAPPGPALANHNIGPLVLSLSSKRANWRGCDVPLSRNEFEVVRLLAEQAGQDIGYRQLYDTIRGDGFVAGHGEDGYRANVRAMVKRIRHKFTQLDPAFAALQNYPGFGYRWQQDG